MKTEPQTDGAELLRQCAAGIAGGLVGALAMNLFARAVASARGGHEAPGAAPGPDRTGRGVQPPQADGHADEDAAVKTGSLAYEAVTGRTPDEHLRPWLGSGVHYSFSAAAGLLYGAVASRFRIARAGYGTFYGALVWAVADEGIVPALGLSREPRQLDRGVHAYALAGHLIFGASLEATRRFFCPPRDSSPPRRHRTSPRARLNVVAGVGLAPIDRR